MNILTLSNCPLSESQGSGYVILSYVHGLRQLGHTVECVGPDSYEFWPKLRRARRWRLAFGMALLALRRRRFSSYDLVELYGAESWLVVLLLRVTGTRCLLVHHSNGLETLHHLDMTRNGGNDTLSGEPRRWYQFRAKSLLTIAFKWVDALVLVSRFEHRFAVQMGYQPAARVIAIETPLPDQYLGQPLNLHRPPTFGFCGAWLWRKGTDLLREAANRLLELHKDATLHLVGVGSTFDKHSVFRREVCDRIHVTPFIETKLELMTWYQSISVFLMPSYSESFGLVTAEAMSCGCAVVATRTGFAADLNDGQEALILASFTAQDLADAASKLIEHDSLREAIARNGHERVQTLRWSAAAKELESFFLRLLDAKRSR